ncbi:hypothetical protein N7451_012319 [Penicillium sp. IBT 35674x]|nr:hypothetical protein N7451_012319 [Penicillium sp. IBT 35674x]
MTCLRPVLLAGGQSSRMGTRKELLSLESDEPLYMRLIALIHEAVPETDLVYLSLRDPSAMKGLLVSNKVRQETKNLLLLDLEDGPLRVHVLFDRGNNENLLSDNDIGPARGLLRAHQTDQSCNWLVVACDYPLLTVTALQQLRHMFGGAVTCFCNKDGFSEPLLAIWTPEALRTLSENVQQGILGPSSVVRQLNGVLVQPQMSNWLMNANTQEDWVRIIETKRKVS